MFVCCYSYLLCIVCFCFLVVAVMSLDLCYLLFCSRFYVVRHVACVVVMFFFFCKQKRAYEMRMSDWSSDVCASDLQVDLPVPGSRQAGRHDRFLPVADPKRQGSEAVPGQGPARPEALGKAGHAQYRQSAELWCSDHRIEARRKAGPGDGPPAGEVSQ